MSDTDLVKELARRLAERIDATGPGEWMYPAARTFGDGIVSQLAWGYDVLWCSEGDNHRSGEWPECPEGLDPSSDEHYDNIETALLYVEDRIRGLQKMLGAMLPTDGADQ
jgi:hypothetical protein